MEQFEINAEPRANLNKGANRRLRDSGKVPGILYGARAEAQPIEVLHADLQNQLKREAFFSHILTLKLSGKPERVVLKDLQRHPYRPLILHIDFLRVSETEALTMRVPIHFINEDVCIGVKQNGGVISHVMNEIEISCLPKDLPEYIEIDLAAMDIGHSVHVGEVKLPPGVKIHGEDPDRPVVSVHIPRAIEVEEEVPAAAAVVVEPGAVPAVEGAPAPEAAGGAKPVAGKPAPEKAEKKPGGKDKG